MNAIGTGLFGWAENRKPLSSIRDGNARGAQTPCEFQPDRRHTQQGVCRSRARALRTCGVAADRATPDHRGAADSSACVRWPRVAWTILVMGRVVAINEFAI